MHEQDVVVLVECPSYPGRGLYHPHGEQSQQEMEAVQSQAPHVCPCQSEQGRAVRQVLPRWQYRWFHR